ncbi:hypothetical protein Taro_005687 [Colocasia esculenta]|uniref:Uncharacterized protein n=1 Tax=Colocasia esculenta TaxID=4460 RepID=A0A843TTS9_COLES|nr:hypothetical protein [Colocasia esculenta]
MQGLVQAMQTQAHTQAALQAQLEAQGAQRGASAPAAVAAAAPATGSPGRPRAPARVIALAREDAEQAEHVTEDPEISGDKQAQPLGRSPQRLSGHPITSPGDPLLLGGSLDLGEGFPNTGLKLALTENQEEGTCGGFLGLPKESFNSNLDRFEDLIRARSVFLHRWELGVNSSCRQDLQSAASDLAVHLLERPNTVVKFFSAEQ